MELESLLSFIETTNSPCDGIGDDPLIVELGEFWASSWGKPEHTANQVQTINDFERQSQLHDGLIFDVLLQGLNYFPVIEELNHELLYYVSLFSSSFQSSQLAPSLIDCFVTEIIRRNVDLTTSGHSGGWSIVQVLNLEHQFALIRHGDSFTVGKSQNLVVIEHSVETFNPNGIDGTIASQPDVEFGFSIIAFLPKSGEHTWDPVVWDLALDTIHFLISDGLGVHLNDTILQSVGNFW